MKHIRKSITMSQELIDTIDNLRSKERPIPSFSQMVSKLMEIGIELEEQDKK